MTKEIWIEDRYNKDMVVRFLCHKQLFSGQSPYQKVEIYTSSYFGKILFNDNIVMVTEKDEFVYHDMIAHVPLFVHPCPKNVLIIGGGDGGSAREVLRHNTVEKCTVVEIDEMVVSACKKHIQQTACSFSHPKMNLIIGDGVKFVKETSQKFDVVIVDSTDPIGPAVPLFDGEFYKNVNRILNEEGIVVSQMESPFYNIELQKNLARLIQSIFPIASMYYYGNISYAGVWWFLFASKTRHPLKDFDSDRAARSGLDFQYYNPDVHRASFAHPCFVKKEIPFL